MRHLDRATAALSLALLLAPRTIAAQDAVPGELVRVLVTSGAAGRPPQIAVGRVPEGFPPELVPAGGRVLGGIRRDSSSMVLAVAVPQEPPAATRSLQQSLAGAGWSAPNSSEPRGFVATTAPAPWRFMCRGHEMVSLGSTAAPGGGAYLRVDYSRQNEITQCTLMQSGARGRNIWDEVPLPTLALPDGVMLVTAGFSTGPAMVGVEGGSAIARVRSSLGAAEIASHFAIQLRQAGWTAGTPPSGADAAVQTFRRQTQDGKQWLGVLIAIAVPGTDLRDVRFEVQDVAAPAR